MPWTQTARLLYTAQVGPAKYKQNIKNVVSKLTLMAKYIFSAFVEDFDSSDSFDEDVPRLSDGTVQEDYGR